MPIDTDPIKNKQRIYIGGNHGVNEIFELTRHVLKHIHKPADFFTVGEPLEVTSAPIVIIRGGDALENGKTIFHDLDIHMLLIHQIEEDITKGYGSFEDYIAAYEKLADRLPKAGSFLFFEDDNVAVLMGKKEREDVKSIEYSTLPSNKDGQAFTLTGPDGKVEVKTANDKFAQHAAGAKALLNRIGVSDSQFFSALKTLS